MDTDTDLAALRARLIKEEMMQTNNVYKIRAENKYGMPISTARKAKGYKEIAPAKASIRNELHVKRAHFMIYNETKKRFIHA